MLPIRVFVCCKTLRTRYQTVYKFKKNLIKKSKPRTSHLITGGDQRKTNKSTKALLVKFALATGRKNYNGS